MFSVYLRNERRRKKGRERWGVVAGGWWKIPIHFRNNGMKIDSFRLTSFAIASNVLVSFHRQFIQSKLMAIIEAIISLFYFRQIGCDSPSCWRPGGALILHSQPPSLFASIFHSMVIFLHFPKCLALFNQTHAMRNWEFLVLGILSPSRFIFCDSFVLCVSIVLLYLS